MRDLVRPLRLLDAIGVIAGLGWNMALSVIARLSWNMVLSVIAGLGWNLVLGGIVVLGGIAVLGATGASRQGRRQRRPGRCHGWECRFVFWSLSDLDLEIARSWRRWWGIHATARAPPGLDP